MPVTNLGAIMIDEAHEPSYKQEKAPKYSALRVASILGKNAEARVIFGSATPLVADRFLAESSNSPIVELTKSARASAKQTYIELVDMTKRTNFKHHRFLSDQLIESITNSIATGQQALIFHNRRGSASTTLCEECGWTAECPNCYVPLVLHADKFKLSCHICSYTARVPISCPSCQSAESSSSLRLRSPDSTATPTKPTPLTSATKIYTMVILILLLVLRLSLRA